MQAGAGEIRVEPAAIEAGRRFGAFAPSMTEIMFDRRQSRVRSLARTIIFRVKNSAVRNEFARNLKIDLPVAASGRALFVRHLNGNGFGS